MNVQKLLGVVIALQVVILMTLWLGGPVSTAHAQIPDAGAQNVQIIDQIQASNDKLDKLIAFLQSGKLQVQLSKPDDNHEKTAP